MKALVIYGHPNKKGHNGFILKSVLKKLDERHIDYKMLDLYHMKFNPVLDETELYTQGKKPKKDVLKYQKLIREADELIIIYPVWWNSMPGIVKGFFDRVLTPGFAYYFKHLIFNQGYPVGLLKNKTASVFLTTGSNRWLYKIFTGARAHKQVKRDLLGMTGMKVKVFHLDSCLKFDERAKKRIKVLVRKAFKRIL
ncbi:MAG: NAD(P)H-dependent oxidoreductase [Candidatus Woesearchaeota archaeon]